MDDQEESKAGDDSSEDEPEIREMEQRGRTMWPLLSLSLYDHF